MGEMQDIAQVARERLGFDRLRPGQEHAVRAVLDGRDTLVVMATGAGKSAIYQIAGWMIEGATLVISPLISLQRDQIENIEEEQPGEAAAIDASVSETKREERLEELADEELEFLFLAPEQLAREETMERLGEANVSLVVVDEAHCVSEWGHDFRPDYLRIGPVVDRLGSPTVLALTATASAPVREEIVERLHMREPEVIIRGFDRPNIRLEVDRHHDEHRKRRALVERARSIGGPGIVYVATRKGTEQLAAELEEAGMRALPYHAGLSKSHRDGAQEAFMGDELDVIAATTAFGMGVDKPNVRFVLHSEPSDSVDSYFQEIGRAGRDGEPAEAVLFYRTEDLGMRRFFAGGGDSEERREWERSRVEMMRAYAEHEHCRRRFVLSYFGEASDPCGHCDNCEAGRGPSEEGDQPFAVGANVIHPDWGEGAVQRYDGDRVVVLFDSVGYRTLSVELVTERGLLEAEPSRDE
jgi:ATP-dependent DNA helicase RecQ